MRKKFNLLQLASKGRKGDTEIRRVDGRLSHVNKTEANWIDIHGKTGEAMTQAVGSGTINPETGMREYAWYNDASWWTGENSYADWLLGEESFLGDKGPLFGGENERGPWKPNQGDFGYLGSTPGASDARDERGAAAGRKASFESYMEQEQDTNVAGLQTESTLDDTPGAGTNFTAFIERSGISDTASDDMNRYITKYDSADEDKIDLAQKTISDNVNDAADQNSQGLLSMVNASSQNASQRGFANAGSFEQEFAKKQAIQNAERTFAGLDRSRQSNEISRGQLHTEYNKDFWDEMMSWSNTINA